MGTRQRQFCLVVTAHLGDTNQDEISITAAKIIYIAENSWDQKGEIPLTADTFALTTSERTFEVHKRNRVYVLEDPSGSVSAVKQWVHWITVVVTQLYPSVTHDTSTIMQQEDNSPRRLCVCTIA